MTSTPGIGISIDTNNQSSFALYDRNTDDNDIDIDDINMFVLWLPWNV